MTVTSSVVKLNNGLSIPMFGLGTYQSKSGEVGRAVEHALRSGYRHLDCAALYGNEVEVGMGIRASGVPRDEIFVTSKLWNTRHHPQDVETSCRKSLTDLGLTYLDLYLIHWPTAMARGEELMPKNSDGTLNFDINMSPLETYFAMEKLVKKGLVRSIGLSNFNSAQVADIMAVCSVKPVTNQVECHPYLNQSKLLDFCSARNITLTAYSPLAQGSGKPGEVSLLDQPNIRTIAGKYKKSPAQVILRWQVQRGVIVIPKSVTPSRIEENAKVFDFTLTEEEMVSINSLDCKGRVTDAFKTSPRYPFNIEF